MIRFYYGSDLGKINAIALKEINNDNLIKIDLFKDSFKNVIDELSSFSLFDEEKNMIVYNSDFFSTNKSKIISKKDEENLILLLKDLPSSFNISFINLNKITKSSFLDELKKIDVKFIEVKEYSVDEYYALFLKLAKENNKEVDRKIFDEFFSRINNDYLTFINEANKLFTYPDKIDKEVISKLINMKVEDNVFSLCNLILSINKNEAIKCYRDLRFLNNDSLQLLLIMVSQFRFIAMVKYLSEKKMSNDEIASSLSLKDKKVSSGRIYYVLKDTKNYQYKDIINILFRLAKIEEDIKLNLDNADYLLEMFILNS